MIGFFHLLQVDFNKVFHVVATDLYGNNSSRRKSGMPAVLLP